MSKIKPWLYHTAWVTILQDWTEKYSLLAFIIQFLEGGFVDSQGFTESGKVDSTFGLLQVGFLGVQLRCDLP